MPTSSSSVVSATAVVVVNGVTAPSDPCHRSVQKFGSKNCFKRNFFQLMSTILVTHISLDEIKSWDCSEVPGKAVGLHQVIIQS